MANAKNYQEIETEPIYIQEILPTPTEATKKCQRPNIAFKGNSGGKRIVVQLETLS